MPLLEALATKLADLTVQSRAARRGTAAVARRYRLVRYGRGIVVRRVLAREDDLYVQGFVDGIPIAAHGWVSATTNHFDPDAYGPYGDRHPDAVSRQMNEAEQLAYYERLLEEQGPARLTVVYEA